MELTKQVCSLEPSQKLRKLGVKQASYFHWSVPNPEEASTVPDKEALKEHCKVELSTMHWGIGFDDYAAFTVAELGEMLLTIPPFVNVHTYLDASLEWWCVLPIQGGIDDGLMFTADTEADARAKMLIYLIENNLLTV